MIYYALTRREGAISVAFVRPSVRASAVCPCVRLSRYIANNSRTQRPSVPKFGRKIPHLWRDSHTSFKVKRLKIKVTRPINAHTHRAPYLPNGKAYKLQTWYTDGGRRRPASATGTKTFKVKDQGRNVTWSLWAVLAQCCTCVIRGWRGHTMSVEPGGYTYCYSLLIRFELIPAIFTEIFDCKTFAVADMNANVTQDQSAMSDAILILSPSF